MPGHSRQRARSATSARCVQSFLSGRVVTKHALVKRVSTRAVKRSRDLKGRVPLYGPRLDVKKRPRPHCGIDPRWSVMLCSSMFAARVVPGRSANFVRAARVGFLCGPKNARANVTRSVHDQHELNARTHCTRSRGRIKCDLSRLSLDKPRIEQSIGFCRGSKNVRPGSPARAWIHHDPGGDERLGRARLRRDYVVQA